MLIFFGKGNGSGGNGGNGGDSGLNPTASNFDSCNIYNVTLMPLDMFGKGIAGAGGLGGKEGKAMVFDYGSDGANGKEGKTR